MLSLLRIVAAFVAATTSNAVAPAPSVKIAVAFDPLLPATVRRLALGEAAAVWLPYGVALMSPEAASLCTDADVAIDARLTVTIADSDREAEAWAMPFATIGFRLGRGPDDTIRLHYRALTRVGLPAVEIGGLRESQWPVALREHVLGRMIGRVVAHEIGHWVLVSREHSAFGLMRAVHRVSELADPSLQPFLLMPADVQRLREMTAH